MYLDVLRELIDRYGVDATIGAVLAAETALQEKRCASTTQLPLIPLIPLIPLAEPARVESACTRDDRCTCPRCATVRP